MYLRIIPKPASGRELESESCIYRRFSPDASTNHLCGRFLSKLVYLRTIPKPASGRELESESCIYRRFSPNASTNHLYTPGTLRNYEISSFDLTTQSDEAISQHQVAQSGTHGFFPQKVELNNNGHTGLYAMGGVSVFFTTTK